LKPFHGVGICHRIAFGRTTDSVSSTYRKEHRMTTQKKEAEANTIPLEQNLEKRNSTKLTA
jgi:hypothetical protein